MRAGDALHRFDSELLRFQIEVEGITAALNRFIQFCLFLVGVFKRQRFPFFCSNLFASVVVDVGQIFDRNSNPMLTGDCPVNACLLYTSPSPRDGLLSRMPSSA